MNEDARILIVDDDPQILRAHAILFERAGYHVTTAPTGREGLRLARETEPDLVLLDVVLPDLGGVEVCRRIKSDPALQRTMVVLITALKKTPEEQTEALEAGADTVIRRPIASRELLARIKSLLRIQRAEEKVRASEARYRYIVENAPIGIYRTTPEGEVVMANPALVEMLGYDSFEELTELDLETEGYSPEYSRRDFERRIQEQGEVRGFESAWRRKDGTKLFIRENARPVYDEDGRLVCYQGTVEDVTERVRRTRHLERLNTVLDAIREVNHLIVRERDPHEIIEGACHHLVETRGYRTAWIALFGRDGEPTRIAQQGLEGCLPCSVEQIGEEGLDLCGTEALSRSGVWAADAPCDCCLADAYQGDKLMAIRLEHGGTVRGLMTVSLPSAIEVDEREKGLFSEVATDIAFALQTIELEEERIRAERALLESRERYRILFESTGTATCVFGADRVIRMCNDRFAALARLPKEQIEGRIPWTDFVADEDLDRMQRYHDQRSSGSGNPPTDYPFTFVDAEGHQRDIYLQLGLITEAGDRIASLTDITPVKRAQEALRENKQFLRQIIDTSPNCIFVKDWNGRYVLVNQAITELYESSRERMIGRTDRELARLDRVTPQAAARFLADDQEVVRSGEPKVIPEEPFTREDGTVRWFQTVKVPLTSPGAPPRLLGVASDITARKQAEEEIEWLARFPSENPNPVLRVGQDGREILYTNEPGEAILAAWRQSAGDSMREMWQQFTLDVLETGETRTAEIELDDRVFSLTFAPVPESGYVNVYALDITERRTTTERLRRLSSAVEQSIEGVIITDMEGDILYVNRTAEELYGYTREELMGQPVFLLNAEPANAEMIQGRFLTKGRWSGEVEQRCKDGSTFPALVSLFTVESETDGIDAAVALVRDITDRRQMQIQLRQQERLAAVGQLAGGIAHDFNNILASIILYAQMPLDADELPPKAKHACQTILQESHRAADLVQQILDFSRSAMVETEPLDLADLIQESLTLLRRTIPEHIRLVSEVTCRPCIIQADPTRIHQVLMNLALNAKDAMPDGGQITIGLQSVRVAPDDEPPVPDMSPGAWAYITVSDTGVGMSDEVRSHLFEPFFTTKEEGEGTGLGLAQVYGIVKQHHGLIDVDTAPGEGTTFAVYFPLIQNGSEPGSEEEETVPLEGNGEKILVVEDADPLRQAVRAGLEAFGYRVVTATDGRAALETLVHDDIDLVLTDVVMPGMGGEELLKHLREQGHGTKVIAMTGHVVDIDVQGLRAEGFAEALPKPFSIEQLAAVVRRTLRGS